MRIKFDSQKLADGTRGWIRIFVHILTYLLVNNAESVHVDYTAIIPFISDAVNMHTKTLHKQSKAQHRICERVHRIETGSNSLNARIVKLEQRNNSQMLVNLPAFICVLFGAILQLYLECTVVNKTMS
jgi:hypothetical protein